MQSTIQSYVTEKHHKVTRLRHHVARRSRDFSYNTPSKSISHRDVFWMPLCNASMPSSKVESHSSDIYPRARRQFCSPTVTDGRQTSKHFMKRGVVKTTSHLPKSIFTSHLSEATSLHSEPSGSLDVYGDYTIVRMSRFMEILRLETCSKRKQCSSNILKQLSYNNSNEVHTRTSSKCASK